MDLQRYLRMLRRFWPLAMIGVLAAGIGGVLAVARIQHNSLAWKKPLVYQSTAVMLVSGQKPWWAYATLPLSALAAPTTTGTSKAAKQAGAKSAAPAANATQGAASPVADPSRLAGLAALYGYFVNSDAVRQLTGGEPDKSVQAANVVSDQGSGRSDPLPLVRIIATAPTPQGAMDLGRRVTAAFQSYVLQQQTAGGVPPQSRITLQLLNAPGAAQLVSGRSFTRAVALAVGVLVLTFLVILLAENVRPSTRERDARAAGGDGEHFGDSSAVSAGLGASGDFDHGKAASSELDRTVESRVPTAL